MPTIHVKRGDDGSAGPDLTLLDGDGQPVDLTGATVRFYVAPVRTGDSPPDPISEPSVIIIDAVAGRLRPVWDDMPAPGLYRAEVEVTYEGGVVETFPPERWLLLQVWADLGPAESS